MELNSRSTLAQKAQEWVEQPGNSYELLAVNLGISSQAIRNKVYGQSDFWWSEVIKAADLFGCSVSDFVK